MQFLTENSGAISAASNLLVAISLVISVPYYFYTRQKEKKRYVQDVYRHLMDEYTEMLGVLLDNAELDFYGDNIIPRLEDPLSNRKRKIILSMLIALFERSYILHNEYKWLRQRHWEDWKGYMASWVNRESFITHMSDTVENDDTEFISFLSSLKACPSNPKQPNVPHKD